jgi:hypothetical protein
MRLGMRWPLDLEAPRMGRERWQMWQTLAILCWYFLRIPKEEDTHQLVLRAIWNVLKNRFDKQDQEVQVRRFSNHSVRTTKNWGLPDPDVLYLWLVQVKGFQLSTFFDHLWDGSSILTHWNICDVQVAVCGWSWVVPHLGFLWLQQRRAGMSWFSSHFTGVMTHANIIPQVLLPRQGASGHCPGSQQLPGKFHSVLYN